MSSLLTRWEKQKKRQFDLEELLQVVINAKVPWLEKILGKKFFEKAEKLLEDKEEKC
jgi:hypothetical protein